MLVAPRANVRPPLSLAQENTVVRGQFLRQYPDRRKRSRAAFQFEPVGDARSSSQDYLTKRGWRLVEKLSRLSRLPFGKALPFPEAGFISEAPPPSEA